MGVYFNFKFNHLADLLPAAVKAHGNVLRPKTTSCKLGLLFLKVFLIVTWAHSSDASSPGMALAGSLDHAHCVPNAEAEKIRYLGVLCYSHRALLPPTL